MPDSREDLYRAMGGVDGCRRLSEAFYARVDHDSLLRPLFPGTTLTCAIEEFAAFLVQLLGGPAEHTQRRWWVSLRESHLRFKITQKHRDAWMKNMIRALDDVPVEGPLKTVLRGFFEHSSTYVVNEGQARPAKDPAAEIADRWQAQRNMDEAVAAIRTGNAELACRLAENATFNVIGLLALMIRAGGPFPQYLRKRLAHTPDLVQERHGGRTLLHEAAACGDASLVELLLNLGADPDAHDGGSHTPLYSLGNECRSAGAGTIVELLVRAGASVDARDGVKRCTALHMAARRGNAEIARALLDAGADIEARDSLGETPLRRAVNCNKVDVAALLISRGADRNSIGSKRLTPRLAARSDAMRKMFTSGSS